MQYDFETRVDRQNLATIRELKTPESVKTLGFISLWGAEFEFMMPPFIIKGLKDWLDSGTIAYTAVDEDYLTCVSQWMKLQRQWEIETDWIVPTYGLSHSVGTICRAFTEPGDGVIGLTPTYLNTFNPVHLNDRIQVNCPLIYDKGGYSIDYDKLERLMQSPRNKVLSFCNPHNPIAKVWGRQDLEKIAQLAIENDIIIYSDEIFAETVYEGVEMLTFDQVFPHKDLKCIVGTSLGKTYSMTGISHANMIIKNEPLRQAFLKQRNRDHFGSLDPLVRASYFAGCTQEGSQWLKAMMAHCHRNYLWMDAYFKKEIPQLKIIEPEGSYILWIDCQALGFETDEAYEAFFESAHCIWDVGTTYDGDVGFVRMNLSVPFEDLKKVIYQLKSAVDRMDYD